MLTVLVLGPSTRHRVAARSTRLLEGNIGERGRRKRSGRGRGKEKHCIPRRENGNSGFVELLHGGAPMEYGRVDGLGFSVAQQVKRENGRNKLTLENLCIAAACGAKA